MPLLRPVTAFRLGAAVAPRLPEPLAVAIARAAGLAVAEASWTRRLVVERNQQRAHGGELRGAALRRAVQRTFESYARYWVESFRLPATSTAVIDAGMSHQGFEHIEEARAAGRGVILALPHVGGWEWAAAWLTAVNGLPLTAVAEPLEPSMYEWFASFRRSLGMNIVPLGPGAGREVMRALRDNHVVCLLCDRDIAGGGVEVEFFGERTTLPGGPAMLALRTGAALMPTAAYFQGRGHLGVVGPPMVVARHGRLSDDVGRLTQALAGELEALIRVAPEQWLLMQPNWPSDVEALARHRPRPYGGARAPRLGVPLQPHHPGRRAGTGAGPGEGVAGDGARRPGPGTV